MSLLNGGGPYCDPIVSEWLVAYHAMGSLPTPAAAQPPTIDLIKSLYLCVELLLMLNVCQDVIVRLIE